MRPGPSQFLEAGHAISELKNEEFHILLLKSHIMLTTMHPQKLGAEYGILLICLPSAGHFISILI